MAGSFNSHFLTKCCSRWICVCSTKSVHSELKYSSFLFHYCFGQLQLPPRDACSEVALQDSQFHGASHPGILSFKSWSEVYAFHFYLSSCGHGNLRWRASTDFQPLGSGIAEVLSAMSKCLNNRKAILALCFCKLDLDISCPTDMPEELNNVRKFFSHEKYWGGVKKTKEDLKMRERGYYRDW